MLETSRVFSIIVGNNGGNHGVNHEKDKTNDKRSENERSFPWFSCGFPVVFNNVGKALIRSFQSCWKFLGSCRPGVVVVGSYRQAEARRDCFSLPDPVTSRASPGNIYLTFGAEDLPSLRRRYFFLLDSQKCDTV